MYLAHSREFFLYMGASDLVPDSYHDHPKGLITALTILGTATSFCLEWCNVGRHSILDLASKSTLFPASFQAESKALSSVSNSSALMGLLATFR